MNKTEEEKLIEAATSAASEICEKIKLENAQRTEKLKSMFSKCFINTVSTTVELFEKTEEAGEKKQKEAFLITGDIHAMWLRDSSVQVVQYLRFLPKYQPLREFVKSLIVRQFEYIAHDPYANAFMENETCVSKHSADATDAGRLVWERKYELDSLCYPIWLLHKYHEQCPKAADFPDRDTIAAGLNAALGVMETERDHSRSPYKFERICRRPTDTLARGGLGPECAPTGMIWSGFRPSDDACTYSYLVPSNIFAVEVLKYVEELADELPGGGQFKARAEVLREGIRKGVADHAIIDDPEYGRVYAYEVDGLGHSNIMDDANVPSLLSLPWLGCEVDEDIYANTRRLLLSSRNPWYFSGKEAAGIGSPHTGTPYIWPIALVTEGLTEKSRARQLEILDTLMDTTADTGFMHESFHCDDQKDFSRSWFAWANSFFAYYVDTLFSDNP